MKIRKGDRVTGWNGWLADVVGTSKGSFRIRYVDGPLRRREGLVIPEALKVIVEANEMQKQRDKR